MESGKAQVLSALAKINRPFRPATVVQMCDLDRQLVQYHLTKFVENGWVEKNGRTYEVTDQERIVNELVDAMSKDSGQSKPTAKGYITKQAHDTISNDIQQMIYLRILRVEEYQEMQEFFNIQIDQTVQYLKGLKRWLNGSQPSPHTARKYLNVEDLWVGITELGYTPKIKKSKWLESVEERKAIYED